MKILVMSDSHGARRFMKLAVDKLKPDAVVHLGDFYDDAQTLAEEHPHLRFHTVPGNCDYMRCRPDVARTLCYDVCGVRLYMTHGHLHGVKSGTWQLAQDAKKAGARAALFGHTHQAFCRQAEGMWVLNPGSCGSSGGSVAMIETKDDEICGCRIVTISELEGSL